MSVVYVCLKRLLECSELALLWHLLNDNAPQQSCLATRCTPSHKNHYSRPWEHFTTLG